MSTQELEQFVTTDVLTKDLAAKYLTLYLGESEWKDKIDQLFVVQKKKYTIRK